MSSSIKARRIAGSTAYKILLTGSVVMHSVLTLLAIVLALLGWLPVEAADRGNADSIQPVWFLFGYLVLGILLSPLWVGVLWLSVWPGVWLYSVFRPMVIRYVPEETDDKLD